MTLDDFLPYVLPLAKGCSEPLAKQRLRLAIIDLCKRSMVWREFQTSVPTVLNQTAYAYAPATGQQVLELLEVKLNGIEVPVVSADEGKALDNANTIYTYAYGKLGGFELRPAQAAAQPIVTYSVVGPALTANTVPDAFGKYVEGIAAGALARLYATPGMEFTNAQAAGIYAGLFESTVGDATDDAMKGAARVPKRVAASWL